MSEEAEKEPLFFCVETAGEYGGIAFLKGPFLWELKFSAKRSYSNQLFQFLPEFLKNAPFTLEEVDFLVVDVGPGSFTGLRVGLSVIKALTLVYEKPVIPVESLAVLAFTYGQPGYPLLSLIDAYTGEVFLGGYEWKGEELVCWLKPTLLPLAKVPEIIKEETLLISETLERWKRSWEGFGKFLYLPRPVELSAGLSGRFAQYLYARGLGAKIVSGEEVLPLYLKPSQAERQAKICHGKVST